MRIKRCFVAVLGCAIAAAVPLTLPAQDILSFQNGYLTFENTNTSLYYRIEFKPNLTGSEEWDGSFKGLRNIKSSDPLVTVPVGVFYRVASQSSPFVGGTALPADLLAGKTAYVNDEEITGTMPDRGAPLWTPGTSDQSLDPGYYSGGTVKGDAALVAGNIRSGVSIFGVAGKTEVVDTADADATAADILKDKTAYVDGARLTGTIETRTLSADSTAVAEGFYAATTLTDVDSDLVEENIKKGVEIFGVTGTHVQADVPKTGQTTSYQTGDDGELQTGVAWPDPRFTDNDDGTVTDHLTGLVWLKNADAYGKRTWAQALSDCAALEHGMHGLSDGSEAGDWRLPNVRELHSLVDYENRNPPLPTGHPFTNVEFDYYWTSSTTKATAGDAWQVLFSEGYITPWEKTDPDRIWPVRDAK